MSEISKYHIAQTNSNPFGLFSFLTIFKYNKTTHTSVCRPPFPLINSNPSCKELFNNLCKGDIMFYFSSMTFFFLSSSVLTRSIMNLRAKLVIHHWNMHLANIVSLLGVYYLSELRMKGYSDNGLRWKNNDIDFKLYDFTSEYEKNSFWKNLNK